MSGGHPNVDDGHVGLTRLDHGEQRTGISAPAHDLEAGVLEYPGEAFTNERLVVGDHQAHGISTLS